VTLVRSPNGAWLTCSACGTTYDALGVDLKDQHPPVGEGCRECRDPDELEPCPSCGHDEWYADYGPDLRVDHCERCDWPPGSPMSPEEWRAHPRNRLNGRP
jgi:hypothetical protein